PLLDSWSRDSERPIDLNHPCNVLDAHADERSRHERLSNQVGVPRLDEPLHDELSRFVSEIQHERPPPPVGHRRPIPSLFSSSTCASAFCRPILAAASASSPCSLIVASATVSLGRARVVASNGPTRNPLYCTT